MEDKYCSHKCEWTFTIFVAILVFVHQTKSILGKFDKSNPYMKFGSDWVIID